MTGLPATRYCLANITNKSESLAAGAAGAEPRHPGLDLAAPARPGLSHQRGRGERGQLQRRRGGGQRDRLRQGRHGHAGPGRGLHRQVQHHFNTVNHHCVLSTSTGTDLTQFIITTLNKNAKDRVLMLKLEQEMTSLVRDAKKTHHKFPHMSSYHRMVVHRYCSLLSGVLV